MHRHLQLRLLLALAVAIAAAPGTPARAETRRVAVVVGNNVGGAADKPLRFAEEDSAKVADVLAQLGDVQPQDLFLLRGKGRDDLQRLLEAAGRRIAGYRENPADRTVLLFYYSGHSDGEALELGGTRATYAELRGWLARTRADVRVTIVDGCRSGSLVQQKGGHKAAPFEIHLSDQLDASGEVTLTSSAADELSLESREIRGSVFTHHFVSGLRGAADASGDGRVTLAEAYQYAFDHTLAASASAGVRQHPAYDYRLAGKGEIVLTEVAEVSASLELPGGFDRALVVLVRRDQVLAELGAGGSGRVALAPGEYAIRLWKGNQAYAARVTVAPGEAKRVGWAELRTANVGPVTGKGEAPSAESLAIEALSPEAQVEYLEKYLTVDDTGGVFLGRYRKRLSTVELLRTTGRVGEANRARRRAVTAATMSITGYVIMLGGPLYAATRHDLPSQRRTAIMFGSLAAGGALGLAGLLFGYRPPPTHEVRQMADEYNDALRRRLSTPPPATGDGGRTLRILPILEPGLTGLSLSGTF